jgi:hypothetical protein
MGSLLDNRSYTSSDGRGTAAAGAPAPEGSSYGTAGSLCLITSAPRIPSVSRHIGFETPSPMTSRSRPSAGGSVTDTALDRAVAEGRDAGRPGPYHAYGPGSVASSRRRWPSSAKRRLHPKRTSRSRPGRVGWPAGQRDGCPVASALANATRRSHHLGMIA